MWNGWRLRAFKEVPAAQFCFAGAFLSFAGHLLGALAHGGEIPVPRWCFTRGLNQSWDTYTGAVSLCEHQG